VTGTYPIVTMLLGIVLLSEPITATRVAGVAAIATGAILVTR
jgi:drug/metabolite transporter (DMT)-like permease